MAKKKPKIPKSMVDAFVHADPERQRAINITLAISLAGAQVLRERFGFSQEQANEWLRLTAEQARQNRETTARLMAEAGVRKA